MIMQLISKFFLCAVLVLCTTLHTSAQTDSLLLHYTFDNVNGTTVPDESASGVNATLKNDATIVEVGKYHALSLGAGTGYLDLSAAAGNLVRSLGDFTISVYYRVDASASLSGAGFFLWAFSQSAANTATSAPYTAYRLNVQRMATSTGGYQNETGFEIGSESAKGEWIHMLYRQSGTTGQLYLNGVLKGSLATMPLLSNAFTAAPAYNWIGRAPFTTDNYLQNTLVADFRLYNVAVSDSTLQELAAKSSELEYELKYGKPGDFSSLAAALADCRAFLASAGTDYPVNALAELQDEVNLGQTEYDAQKNSQYFIDSRVSALNTKLAAVQALKGTTMSEVSPESGTDHGFIHPGALHTQADFDRIKQLLADGDPTITAAYNALKSGEYAQSSIATWPVWTIIRGGSSGQNYMNVARGAAMAYQNALVYKIGGDTSHADAAVRILMAWARGNRYVSGDTNMSLAAGIYGYELANAAELVRDYEGWSREDFEEFKQYILKTWYPVTIDFLRRRHDTWLNAGYSVGQRPGHYWSNWGLCNTLALMSYGILLDDVHMYNQGVSFYKYDHVGTFDRDACTDRTARAYNWGCNEFVGNLVPVIHTDSRGAFGYLGQMQETGRDAGHEQMALGLAVDICQVGLNQGDDLWAYMDNRIAAGIEYVAARDFSSLTDLPWTEYEYADRRGRYGSSWVMSGPSGAAAESRPYWDRIIGYYEGTRGVKMPYAEVAAKSVRGTNGYDMGGHSYGETSGGYDHLGFSTLTCYRPEMADSAKVPLILSGTITYKGVTYARTNLGGLKYTYASDGTHAIANDGADITLTAVLPAGVSDNGSWRWSTGETTRSITVKADHSYIYRVYYTCDNGSEATQMFSIAVEGDCTSEPLNPEITVDGIIYSDTTYSVLYGENVILYAGNYSGWGSGQWDNGATTNVIVIPNITSSRTYTYHYTNQGGNVAEKRFHIEVVPATQYIQVGTATAVQQSEAIVTTGSKVTLSLAIPDIVTADDITWQDGTTGTSFVIDSLTTTATYTATLRFGGEDIELPFLIYAKMAEDSLYDVADYYIRDVASDTYLTNTGDGAKPSFQPYDESLRAAQTWHFDRLTKGNYKIMSVLNNAYITRTGELRSASARIMRIESAAGTPYVAIYANGTELAYWVTNADGTVDYEGATELYGFPYQLTLADAITGISTVTAASGASVASVSYFTTDGRRQSALRPGINIVRETLTDGTVRTRKLLVK